MAFFSKGRETEWRSPHFRLAFIFVIITLITFMVAFASPYWLQTYHNVPFDFKNMGLWEICFNKYYFRLDPFQNVFDGCYWAFDLALENGKRVVFNPPFFVAVQIFSVGSLFMLFGTCVTLFLIFIRCAGDEDFTYWILSLLNTIMMGLVGALQFISILLVGIWSGDRTWMPRADLIWLSWGYAFAVFSSFFAFLAAFYFGRETKKYWGSAPPEPKVFDMPLFRTGDAAIEPEGSVFQD